MKVLYLATSNTTTWHSRQHFLPPISFLAVCSASKHHVPSECYAWLRQFLCQYCQHSETSFRRLHSSFHKLDPSCRLSFEMGFHGRVAACEVRKTPLPFVRFFSPLQSLTTLPLCQLCHGLFAGSVTNSSCTQNPIQDSTASVGTADILR